MTTMESLVKFLMCTPTDDGMGAPAMFWGPPGIAKTKVLRSLAAMYSMPIQILSPGLMGEGAFGVTPVPDGVGKQMRIHYPAPSWVEQFEDIDGNPIPGLVFIDEITTAPPALQPPLLGLIQERRVGNHYLGAHVRVLGAGNPPQQAAGGWDLAPPVANRMGHFDWAKPEQAQWSDYMLQKGGTNIGKSPAPVSTHSLEDLEKQVKVGWADAYARTVGLVTAFTSRRQELYYKMPVEGDPQGSRAWPSLRSWDLAVSAMTTATILGATEIEQDILAAGFVGSGTATEFVAFKSNMDLPDPVDLLEGRAQFKHDPARLDRSMAILSSCAALVAPQTAENRDTRAGQLWTMIAQVLANAPDVGVPAARTLAKAKLGHVKSATPVLTKLRAVLEAAGVTAAP